MKEDKERCPWCLGFPEYITYHDEEWGVPVYDDQKQFEFLVLESAQAGLSWSTILKKRAGYREVFAEFDPTVIVDMGEGYVLELLEDKQKRIIRNRAKIEATIHNARIFLDLQAKFSSFSDYIWDFVNGKPIVNKWRTLAEVPASTPESDKLAKDMKKKGFKFLGSTTLYAHMQATGLVNDHLVTCFRHSQV
ncbi:DNA-3-methyladenine glycosylase I [Penaeicola halotolerans]|uniref:DNA-3-methyladenine glycosylase I n=1 Tax=Penaeicola halotolerans TaxID=2793196 RepID=UPI001CF8A63C|nr:DNA-3-methyladenine glycosylase I [Penaeicola halotolerans]